MRFSCRLTVLSFVLILVFLAFSAVALAEGTKYTPNQDGGLSSSNNATWTQEESDRYYDAFINGKDYTIINGVITFGDDTKLKSKSKENPTNKIIKEVYIYDATTPNKNRIVKMKKDTPITVTGFSGKYAIIEYNGETAYVLADNINAKLSEEITAAVSSKAYLYAKRNTNKKYRTEQLTEGTEITLTARYGTWWEVKLNEEIYYIQSKYVSLPD